MRRLATAAILVIATIVGALTPALGQCDSKVCNPPPRLVTIRGGPTPLSLTDAREATRLASAMRAALKVG